VSGAGFDRLNGGAGIPGGQLEACWSPYWMALVIRMPGLPYKRGVVGLRPGGRCSSKVQQPHRPQAFAITRHHHSDLLE